MTIRDTPLFKKESRKQEQSKYMKKRKAKLLLFAMAFPEPHTKGF